MARGDAVIANSNYTAALIERLYPEARERLAVIPRGTDLRAFSPGRVDRSRVAKLRQAWGVAPNERIVLTAARLTGWKGQRVLIEAAARLREQGFEDIRYILAGDAQGRDGYVKELDALIARHNLKGVVSRVGHCADMPAALLAAEVVAVPSTEPEAFGRSAVEAQAMGALVAADERTGWRVPPNDPQALAEALQTALNLGASARDDIARRARVHVEKHFSLQQMKDRTLQVYLSLLHT